MMQSESPRAALTAEGVAEKPNGSFDGSSVQEAPRPAQPAQLSRSETEENFRQVLGLQSATAELIILASRFPQDSRGLAVECAALAERALSVCALLERDEERRQLLAELVAGATHYQRELVFEMIEV